MKKLLDSKFLFIVALSLIILIVLVVGAFYLFDDSDATFVKNGYVINPLSSKVEKYFFDEDTSYHENLSQMVVFKDTDNNQVEVYRDSFLHYTDGSLSFLKNGAILDVDSINGNGAVRFYNITNKSIIEKTDNSYVIKNALEDIYLNNFIGRISDDKYIVVGNVEARITGNNSNITGSYFEIVYTEEGVVNIENRDVKYQVTAEGTVMYLGNIAIDLGRKVITNNSEDVMSITAITINGDENIEIIPKAEEEKTDDGNSQNDNQDDQTNQNVPNNNQPVETPDDNNGDGNGEDDGNGNETVVVEREEGIVVSLKEALVRSNNIDITFDTYNVKEDDYLTLKVTNLESNITVFKDEPVIADKMIPVTLLSPNTKYLFTVVNEKDDNIYFQKILETNDFGIKLEKVYATSDKLVFKVTTNENTEVTDAKITLKKFNEETRKNEPVITKYIENGEEKTKEEIKKLATDNGIVAGTQLIEFSNLDSDTIYTVVLDDITVSNANFKDAYNLNLTTMTLKETPNFALMNPVKDIDNNMFQLALQNIQDPDNAIISYTYEIYTDERDENGNLVIDEDGNLKKVLVFNPPVKKTDASTYTVKVGSEEGQLRSDTNYQYRAIIEYYDNEKYIDYITSDSIVFNMTSEPFASVETTSVGFNSFDFNVTINDPGCLVSIDSRTCDLSYENNHDIIVELIEDGTDRYIIASPKRIDLNENGDPYYEFSLDASNGIKQGTKYRVNVRGYRRDTTVEQTTNIVTRGDYWITTYILANFLIKDNGIDKGSNSETVINLETKLVWDGVSGTLSPEDTADNIKRIVFTLYEGVDDGKLSSRTPIIDPIVLINNDGFRNEFYDNGYIITNEETFGITLDELKAKSTNYTLKDTYTIVMNAYYDTTDDTKEIKIENNILTYKINPILLLENIETPDIFLEARTNSNSGLDWHLLEPDTLVGYHVTASFDKDKLSTMVDIENLKLYVYDYEGNPVDFMIEEDGHLTTVSNLSLDLVKKDATIYLNYGTEYNVKDNIMSRGNAYYIGYVVEATRKDDSTQTIYYPEQEEWESLTTKEIIYGKYQLVSPVNGNEENPSTAKENANWKMYIAKSTANSITYRYEIIDPDKALYRENDNTSFGLYHRVKGKNEEEYGEEHKLDLNLASTNNYNTLNGDITISNLNPGDIYQIYYKKIVNKTNSISNDIANYLDGDNANMLFEGEFNLEDSKYNFSFEVLSKSYDDNKATIKIIADDDILNRILSYHIALYTTDNNNNKNYLTTKDNKGNDVNYIELLTGKDNLKECKDGTDDVKCITVDYSLLKDAGMQSRVNDQQEINVDIEVLYDNGLIGFDTWSSGNYDYMIFQNNNTANKIGSYITYNKGGTIESWTDSLQIPVGYYTYTLRRDNINYVSRSSNTPTQSITRTLTSHGYEGIVAGNKNIGVINPKMVSKANVTSDKNNFSFYSITPTVSVKQPLSMINGAILNLEINGISLEEFCHKDNCSGNKDEEYSIYIETWDDISKVGDLNNTVRPTVEVTINNNNNTYEPIIDGLNNRREYYYRVYTYLNKNNQSTYTALFDENDTILNGKFETLGYDDIYIGYDINYQNKLTGSYGDRELKTHINLKAYNSEVTRYSYDIVYILCEKDQECNYENYENNDFLIGDRITKENLITNIDSIKDIPKDFEYGKKYNLKIYAVFNVYEDRINTKPKYVFLNNGNDEYEFKPLEEPSFTIEREAEYYSEYAGEESKKYAIRFWITTNDIDDYHNRVIVDGEYQVKLVDDNGNQVGELQTLNDNKEMVTTTNDTFKATEPNKEFRVIGLSSNTRYRIIVTAEAKLNNYSEEIPVENRTKTLTTYATVYSGTSSGVAFGSVGFHITDTSAIARFIGGSSFKGNVKHVYYTLTPLIGSNDDNSDNNTIIKGNFAIGSGEGEHQFELQPDKNYRLILTDKMVNDERDSYFATVQFEINDDELVTYEGPAPYNK